MAFFRAYIAPLLIVLTFLIAMLAVSARIFLPSDMQAPAPIEEPVGTSTLDGGPHQFLNSVYGSEVSDLSWFLQGRPDDLS